MNRTHMLAGLGLTVQLVLTGWLGWHGFILETDNRIERFAVQGYEQERAYQQFREWFPEREWILIAQQLEPGTTQFHETEARLEQLIKAVDAPICLSLSRFNQPFVTLNLEQLPFPFWQADTGIYTALLVLNPSLDRSNSIAVLRNETNAINKAMGSTIVFLAGEPLVNEALNQGAIQVRFTYFPMLIAFSFLLLGLFFRRVDVLFIITLSVLSSICTTMGLLGLRGQPLNLITSLVPALVFVLAVAMQIHVLMGIAVCGCVADGVRRKLGANFLVSLTTSIGFVSLATSNVKPITELGIAMATGIWIAFLWTHLTYLTLGTLWPPKPSLPRMPFIDWLIEQSRYWQLLAKPAWLVVPLMVILVGAAALLTNPRESNGLNYFPADHPIRKMTGFVESNVTGAAQLELLWVREDNTTSFLPPPEAVSAFTERLSAIGGVRHVLSAYGMARPFLSEPADNVEIHSMTARLTSIDAPFMADYLNPQAFRFTLLVDTLDEPSYRELRDQIEAAARSLDLADGLLITGPLDRVMAIQGYLLTTLALSLGMTVALVLLMMFLTMGRGRYMAAILLANGFPLGMMALAMPLFGIPTTISTVIVFSIAFGVAVDDSIHLLHTCRTRNASFERAWRFALSQDLRAVWLTTVALTGGFLMLTTSNFLPTRDFGILLATGFSAALAGDLIFLPMMLRLCHAPPDQASSKSA